MKTVLALLIVLLLAAGLLFLDGGEPRNDAPVTGLPWQIERLPGGSTRVFGITLGQTTLEEAVGRLGKDVELAIIAAPQESGTLEAYYRHYAAGPVTGSLILVLDIAGEMLSGLRARGLRDSGTRRYLLHPDDLPVAYAAKVKVITFLPTLNLDEAIARARFGTPAEILTADDRQQHWLYPDQGLVLLLDAQGRDLLQYLAQREYRAHRERLRQAAAAGQ
ncbi:MAG: hypothetical protein PVI50_00615 [Gammaproteobacteria bacterium]|jgi:hypothetical protein